jgi:hypothetical protein
MDNNIEVHFEAHLSIASKRSERGMALILCIGFLAILSILGAVVLSVSDNELSASWRERASNDVFFTVDRAVEYALSPPVLANLDSVGDTVQLTDAAHRNKIVINLDNPSKGTELTSGFVRYEGFGGSPINAGKYEKNNISANKTYRYFHVSAQAQHNNNLITDTASVDGEIVMVYVLPDTGNVAGGTGSDEVGTGGN